MIGYIELGIAIVFGMIGTTFTKLSSGYKKRREAVISFLSYIVCYYSFSKCMMHVNLCVAYATWSAIGIIAAAIIGIIVFKEPVSKTAWFGVAFLIVGVFLLNFG